MTGKYRKIFPISFSIKPTLGWDPDTAEFGTEKRRHSDLYVFALLKHQDLGTLNPLNVDQWEFFILPTSVLDTKIRDQKAISLSSLRQLDPIHATFQTLKRRSKRRLAGFPNRKRP